MTGSDVQPIREGLGLNPFQLACILGVHVTTIYRWERTPGPKALAAARRGRPVVPPQINPLQAEILTGLQKLVELGIGPETGAKIAKAVLAGGSLAGLRVALDAITKERNAHA